MSEVVKSMNKELDQLSKKIKPLIEKIPDQAMVEVSYLMMDMSCAQARLEYIINLYKAQEIKEEDVLNVLEVFNLMYQTSMTVAIEHTPSLKKVKEMMAEVKVARRKERLGE